MATQNIQLGNQSEMDDLSNSIDTFSNRVGNVKNKEISPIAFSNSAAGHNGIYRGKDLTNIYTIDQICEMVSDGTFEDLYIGDYITVTISTTYTSNEEVDIVFAGFNTYMYTGSGSIGLSKNHITCVTKDCFSREAHMNTSSSSMTDGGYKSSYMHNTLLPKYATAFQSVLNNHILSHEVWMTNKVNDSTASMAGTELTGAATDATWVSTALCLMNEVQLSGSIINSSSWYDVGERNMQLALFRLAPELKIARLGKDGNRYPYWLSAISSSTSFTSCEASGSCTCREYTTIGARPYFLIG